MARSSKERRLATIAAIETLLHRGHHGHSEDVLVEVPRRLHVVRSHGVVMQSADLVVASSCVAYGVKLTALLRTRPIGGNQRMSVSTLFEGLACKLSEVLPASASRTLHCFFEMGDGGCLAFFQFLPDAYGPADKLPQDGVDHHIAMSVPEFDDIARLKATFDELDYPNCGINHGFCYSLYVRDPNGMLVEFVSDAPNELELNEAAAASAHQALAEWNKKTTRATATSRRW